MTAIPPAGRDAETCEGCDHPLSQHFADVTGVTRCLWSHSGTSTSGVIGLPYTIRCDCANRVSEQANRRRDRERRERERYAEWRESIRAAIRKGEAPPLMPMSINDEDESR